MSELVLPECRPGHEAAADQGAELQDSEQGSREESYADLRFDEIQCGFWKMWLWLVKM